MKTKHAFPVLCLVSFLCCLIAAPIQSHAEDKKAAGKKTPDTRPKVLSVKKVTLSSASVNGKIKVVAEGSVGTLGFTDSALIKTKNPPADGKIHLDFVAKPPANNQTEVVTPISATETIQGAAGKNTIVVRASTNEKESAITVTIGDPP